MDNMGLNSGPINKLILKLAWPAAVGFFFNTMYNVVDTFYGGLVSTEALAALSLSFPVFFLIIAFGTGIGSGTTALMGHSIGAGNKALARHYADQAFVFMFVISVFLTFVGLGAGAYLFRILGASGEYLTLALAYTNVIFYGTVFFMITFFGNAILTAVGDTKTFSKFLVVGFFLNLLLDPWFMFGWLGFPALGLSGVAWATIAIQVIGSIYLMAKIIKTDLINRYFYKDLRPDWKIWKEIAVQGFPASFSMMTVAIGIFVITFFISKFGGAAVAAYGIATRIEQIVLLPTIGLNIAVLVMVAQNAGAKQFGRIREVVHVSMKYTLAILALGAVLVLALARPLMDFFTNDAEVIKIGSEYLRIASLILFSYGILFLYDNALRGLKKPIPSLILGIMRQIVLPFVIFSLVVFVWRLGIHGLWWAIFAVNWMAALGIYFYGRKVLGSLD